MADFRPRRSALYVPGSNDRALQKVRGLPVDTVIFDLEDSVADEVKRQAREAVIAEILKGGFGHREVVIRVNPARTAFFEDDMAAAVKSRPNAVLLSKVESTAEIFAAERHLRGRPETQGIKLWAMVETARGLIDIAEIAASVHKPEGHRLVGLVLGTNDIVRETCVKADGDDRTPVLPWLSMAVLAARSEKLFVLDGVYNDFANARGFEAECLQGRAHGMDGKTLIHPNQVDVANRIFGPSESEVTEAREILTAFAKPENANKGVISINGRMVERMHARMAEQTLKIAEQISAIG